MNEGGKLFFTGQNAGRQWAEGYEVRNFGFAEPPEGGKWCSGTKPEFDKDDPGLADGCIAHNNDFLQYYLGAYVYVAGGQSTDEDGNLLADGRVGSARRADLELRRHRGRQPGQLGDVPGHEHDPRSGPLPDVRQLAQHRQLAAPGRGAVRPVQRHQVRRRGRGRRVLQAAAPGRSRCPRAGPRRCRSRRRTTSSRTTTTCSSRWSSSTAPASRSTARGPRCPTRTDTRRRRSA